MQRSAILAGRQLRSHQVGSPPRAFGIDHDPGPHAGVKPLDSFQALFD
jgi:hypothetical protein